MSVDSLSQMISLLSDVHSRLQGLRNAPAALLKTSISFSSPTIRNDFEKAKLLTETIRSDSVQAALQTAAQSAATHSQDKLDLNIRREIRKRRRVSLFLSRSSVLNSNSRPPSPGSPQPYVPHDHRNASLFPSDVIPPLQCHDLPDYIREFNRTHSSRLHIWTRVRGSTQLGNPAVVRFTIRDVLVCYITMEYSTSESVLVTESIAAFGPREKKSPHSQSDYLVYQTLSQQIARMLQSHPRVSFQSIMNLLCAYEGLFIERCATCERVLSAEGHVPPVARVWMREGGWEARHISCAQV
ncbi:hypothetical protein FB45DRAFT_1019717 [Roridomyces roridus]|uniref:Uncharacterized protein n=1 Tax=Roridomyces roridus TaxID=1738132 RepID=A0AAD7CFJ0_9AGAR|nr:hypothetical protein FB45DRAFT_1019717 [Roridomyces roridus]